MILILTTLSCKITAIIWSSGNPLLTQLSAILVMSNILVGIMITGSKSPATAANTLLVAAIASSINTETLRPLTYIPNGNDRFLNSRRFKIACGNGSLPSYQRLSTSPVFKSRVGCCSSIEKVIANAIQPKCWISMASGSTRVSKLPLTPLDIGQTLFADALPLLGRRTFSYQYTIPCGHRRLVANYSIRAKSFRAMILGLST